MYEYMKAKKRPMPEMRVKNYLYQMLKGLEHLHKNGLFHRDIKPENILVKLPQPNVSGLSFTQVREAINTTIINFKYVLVKFRAR